MPHPLNQLQNIRRAFNFQPWERNVLLRLQMNYVRSIDHSLTLPDSNTRNNMPAESPGLFVFGMPQGWCGDCLVAFQSCDLLPASPTDHLTNHNLQTVSGAGNNISHIHTVYMIAFNYLKTFTAKSLHEYFFI